MYIHMYTHMTYICICHISLYLPLDLHIKKIQFLNRVF